MKVKISSVFLMFLLSITFTGCSDNKAARDQLLNKNSALEAYKAVLQNKTEFFSTDSKENIYLNDFLTKTDNKEGVYQNEDLTNKGLYKNTLKATQFTIVDIDGDKIPEVAVKLSEGNLPIYIEFLHYMNDIVYGYLMSCPDEIGLKADGTFHNGSCDSKMSFKPNAYEMNVIDFTSYRVDNGTKITYYINDKAVSKKSYDSFTNKQSKKKDANWYEFSQKYIKELK